VLFPEAYGGWARAARPGYARRMPSSEPQQSTRAAPSAERGTALRASLLPAVGVGGIMGFLALHEGSGLRAAVVVGVVGFGVVLGMLALKKVFHGG
jgi:hypothetical protein